jgi:hypothetical protein
MSNPFRYLIQEGHVRVAEVEFDLAHLCLTYLSLDQISPQADESLIHFSLLRGIYGLLDYASCFWAQHLTISIRDLHTISSRSSEDLVAAIDALLSVQWAAPLGTLIISKTLAQSLAIISAEESYDSICQAIASNANQLLRSGKGPSNDEPLHLARTIATVRETLEGLMDTPGSAKSELQAFYGSNIFKCDRLNCHYYSNGFSTKYQRDAHSMKHERPYLCKEEGCPQAIIGCVSVKDLQKHVADYHGTADTVEPDYPEESTTSKPEPKAQKHASTHECTVCLKQFTRAHNLRQHMRTHTDERPFACSVCDKAFARQPDRNRHESLHSGEKSFPCNGDLKNGGTWGCGRLFVRADALNRHFKSEMGQACRRLLVEEEEQEKAARAQAKSVDEEEQEKAARAPARSADPFEGCARGIYFTV